MLHSAISAISRFHRKNLLFLCYRQPSTGAENYGYFSEFCKNPHPPCFRLPVVRQQGRLLLRCPLNRAEGALSPGAFTCYRKFCFRPVALEYFWGPVVWTLAKIRHLRLTWFQKIRHANPWNKRFVFPIGRFRTILQKWLISARMFCCSHVFRQCSKCGYGLLWNMHTSSMEGQRPSAITKRLPGRAATFAI